jgi:Uri superfamily endonuclease
MPDGRKRHNTFWRHSDRRATITVMEPQIEAVVRALGTGCRAYVRNEQSAMPTTRGAYVLILRLDKPLDPPVPRLSDAPILPGWYFYAGSARGSGGIRARLSRHFRRDKRPHWHIDRLSVPAAELAAVAVEDGRECDLVDRLLGSPAFRIAVPGFGSSDCRTCASHLLTRSSD